jgi:hypothetical protein
MEGVLMIKIVVLITEEEGGGLTVRFTGNEVKNCTLLEGDVADAFKEILEIGRDEILKKLGFEKDMASEIHKYSRSFSDPEERDKRMKGEQEP